MSDNCKPKTGTKEWAQENVNYLNGCANNCRYCYAAMNANRFGRKKRADWANMEYPNTLWKRKLPRNKKVMFPSSHDLFIEHYPNIFHYLTLLLDRGNSVLIVSKPRREVISKIIADFKDWHADKIEFRFSITSATPEISLRYEPGAPLPQERVDCLKMVLDAGFPASVSMEPYLEPPHVIFDLLDKTIDNPFKEGKLKEVWIGLMNYGVPEELRGIYKYDAVYHLVQRYKFYRNLFFKDSIQKLLHVTARGGPVK